MLCTLRFTSSLLAAWLLSHSQCAAATFTDNGCTMQSDQCYVLVKVFGDNMAETTSVGGIFFKAGGGRYQNVNWPADKVEASNYSRKYFFVGLSNFKKISSCWSASRIDVVDLDSHEERRFSYIFDNKGKGRTDKPIGVYGLPHNISRGEVASKSVDKAVDVYAWGKYHLFVPRATRLVKRAILFNIYSKKELLILDGKNISIELAVTKQHKLSSSCKSVVSDRYMNSDQNVD